MDKIKNEKHNEKTAEKCSTHKKSDSCKSTGKGEHCSTPKAEHKTEQTHH